LKWSFTAIAAVPEVEQEDPILGIRDVFNPFRSFWAKNEVGELEE